MSNTILTIDRVGRCSNRRCIKNHCARHWKNNSERVEAKDLNESNSFKCAYYLPKFTVSGVNEDGNFMVRKQK